MRLFRTALCGVLLCAGLLRAADSTSDDDQKQAPEEIPNFGQLDEYTYVPKSTLSLGARFFFAGPKTSYSGQGTLPAVSSPGLDPSTPNIFRTYDDGNVSPDARTIVVPNGIGQSQVESIPSDGRTNSWSYDYTSQLLPNGNIDFHSYSAVVTDTSAHDVNSSPTSGLELIWDRDMGKLGKRLKWSITAGFSLADIHSSSYSSVPTTLTTLTDEYDLFGQVPPAAIPGTPYSSPTSTTQTITQGSATGSGTQQVDQTILIGNAPIPDSRTSIATSTFAENRYFIEGAYYTLRIGPTVLVPITKKFSLSVSAGPALIYSGAELSVLENLDINANTEFEDLYQKQNNRLLPGYYVDVNLRYDLTDTTGFYIGGVYEGAGSYTTSTASGDNLSYTSRIDFSSQEGIKSGLTVRF